LAELVKLVQGGTVSSTAGKEVLAAMFETGKGARQVVDERGLAQVNDRDAVAEMVRKAIAESPKVVADYYAGKTKAIAAIVGLVMKASRGKANPGMVNEIIVQELEANRK
jgi:aspartyl-tRNA(Asn)/glutamyl-tRNA(Gln) amidotransferase subunit B